MVTKNDYDQTKVQHHDQNTNNTLSSDEKDKLTDNKRTTTIGIIFAIASIPLVMTLGNSMLIPILPTLEKNCLFHPFKQV